MQSVQPIDISVQNLAITIESTSLIKRIKISTNVIRDISFNVQSTQILAIIGGSGSGKTTLLNTLAGRMKSANIDGVIEFNNSNPKQYLKNGSVAYVQQHDYLLPYLTVRETLRYASLLRLPKTQSKLDKYATVESIILELGLKDAADIIIGDDLRNGISGGQKRRVSIGVQLLVNPSIIFMDEPTSGLDAFTSQALFETLKNLALKGRTIVVSVHQPRSDIFKLIDKIVLLSRGDLVYSGPSCLAKDYFTSIGYCVPLHTNIADYIIDISSVDTGTTECELQTKSAVDDLISKWKENGVLFVQEIIPVSPTSDLLEIDVYSNHPTSWIQQVSILSQRGWKNLSNDTLVLYGCIMEVLFIAVFVGYMFYKLDDNLPGIVSRKAIFFLSASLQPYLFLMFMTYKLSTEMRIFDREKRDNMYSTTAYVTSFYLSNMLINILMPLIFAIIIYFMVGLRSDESKYFGIFLATNIALQFVTVSLGFACISLCRTFANASILANTIYQFLGIGSGFLCPVNALPIYMKWIFDVSFVAFGYSIGSNTEFSNRQFACVEYPPVNGIPDNRCSGASILSSQGLTANSISGPFIGLAVSFLVYNAFAVLILIYYEPSTGIHAPRIKSENRKINPKAEEIILTVEKTIFVDVPKINVSISNLNYQIVPKQLFGQTKEITLLQDISCEFKNGQLSVILGASGAGKSTLLNALTRRKLKSGLMNRIDCNHDSITFNGSQVSTQQIHSMCSYVKQNDSHLLPALSARETMHYAALLRLPSSMKRKEKIIKAEEVLSLLGLKDCADTIVGNELVKGLSGGEKRRLSIGVQMINDPSLLVIDEPTSGLDAFTANNIMHKLKEIALSGRTVIVSIHQPRSDIVDLFDQVLLLAKGGRVVYTGPSQYMIGYFESIGHLLPAYTNPADFVIDLTSIDFRNSKDELESKNRVDCLVSAWQKNIQMNHTEVKKTLIDGCVTNHNQSSSLWQSYPILVERSMRNILRQSNQASARVTQVMALGIIISMFFARLSYNQASVIARVGLLQRVSALIFAGMLNCVVVFPQELELFKFEIEDNTYPALSFLLSYLTNEIPFEIVASFLFTFFAVFCVGLQFSLQNFFIYSYLIFCIVNVGESIGMMFCTFVGHVGFSVQIMSAILALFTMMSGFLSIKNMPAFLNAINYISPIKYASLIIAELEFTETLVFTCSDQDLKLGQCLYRNGSDVLQLLNFKASDFQLYMILIAAVTIAYRAAAYVVLRYKI